MLTTSRWIHLRHGHCEMASPLHRLRPLTLSPKQLSRCPQSSICYFDSSSITAVPQIRHTRDSKLHRLGVKKLKAVLAEMGREPIGVHLVCSPLNHPQPCYTYRPRSLPVSRTLPREPYQTVSTNGLHWDLYHRLASEIRKHHFKSHLTFAF